MHPTVASPIMATVNSGTIPADRIVMVGDFVSRVPDSPLLACGMQLPKYTSTLQSC